MQAVSRNRPVLVWVSGKPGAGKTTLAQRLAAREMLGLPVISWDTLRAGILLTRGVQGDDLDVGGPAASRAASNAFISGIEHLLRADVSLIADGSLRRGRSELTVLSMAELATVRLIYCTLPDAEAAQRFIARERALGPTVSPVLGAERTVERMQAGTFEWSDFEPLQTALPTLLVETHDGYQPDLTDVLRFCHERVSKHQ